MTGIINRFNPRICKRCDLTHEVAFLHVLGFNPRICKRCDYWDLITTNAAGVSIHASVKDAT